MAGNELFELHHRKVAPYDIVHAAEAKPENLDALRRVTEGAISSVRRSEPTGIPGVTQESLTWKVTFLGPGKTGVHDAELGDYVVSDMAGGYIAVDKEMFETHYERTHNG